MNAATPRLVRQRAGHRCEHCCIHEDDETWPFHLEHIVPKKHGGKDNPANLAWSCQSCNLAKGANLSGRVQGALIALFNPRRQRWRRHFRWDGRVLVGKTKCGKATIRVLEINAEDRCRLREVLIAAGAFPPLSA